MNLTGGRVVAIVEGKDERYKDRDWLYQRVVVENAAFAQIAREAGVNESTVGYWAKKFDIRRIITWQDINEEYGDEMEELYMNKSKSIEDLCQHFGYAYKTIKKIFAHRDIALRSQSETVKLSAKTRARGYDLNEEYFDKWSSEMAYIVGFINADGNIMYNEKTGNYVLQFGQQADDREILEKIKNALEYEGVVRIYDTKNVNGKDMTIAVLAIHSKRLVEGLMRIGIEERKSLVKSVPDVPEEYIFDYIRGYFDGNGTIDMRYERTVIPSLRLRLTSGSKRHLEELQDILEPHGFTRKNIESVKDQNTHILRFTNDEVHSLHQKFYSEEGSLSMDRKKKRFDECVARRVLEQEEKEKNFKRQKGVIQGKTHYL